METFFSILNILLIAIGALGIFLYGMKLMSDSLQKMAGNKMRTILAKMTDKPIRGILTGTVVTAAIQSSSATTVMVVSFVNAGLLSLAGAIAVIMGANIGTTVTAWIISLFGLGESSNALAFPLIAVAVALPMMLTKKEKLNSISEFIIGLALLLIGLHFLQNAMPNLEEYPNFLEAIATFSGYGYLSIVLFILIGAMMTCLVQASAAMMAITLVMCYKGWIGLDVAVALVMGQNIGTTITANLAAMVANTMAKKAARAHLVFNVLGVVISLVVFYPLMSLISEITEAVMNANPYTMPGEDGYNPSSIPMALSIFHTFFNVVNTLILAWFIPQIIRIVNWMVKSTEEDEETFKLKYIPVHFMNTSELDIESAQQEIHLFSQRVLKMYDFLLELTKAKSEDTFTEYLERIKKYEEITDRMEIEIAKFLTHISETVGSKEGSKKISAMLRIIDNLESIGDSIYHISIMKKGQHEQNFSFGQINDAHLLKMYECVRQSLVVMTKNLSMNYDDVDVTTAYQVEEAINEYRNLLRDAHVEAIKSGEYTYEVGTIYSSVYALYEKIGDFVINVSQAIAKSQETTPAPVPEV
ncbi:MAG: Na/Pi cotransporter family protein [Bacteroidales bacterium]|nr:Na/Pi cotransporter family protein [Bacteroidales bacterium]